VHLRVNKLGIDFVRESMARFSLDGMTSANQTIEPKKSGSLSDARLWETLEVELRRLCHSKEQPVRSCAQL
jgi:hypothetical protein